MELNRYSPRKPYSSLFFLFSNKYKIQNKIDALPKSRTYPLSSLVSVRNKIK